MKETTKGNPWRVLALDLQTPGTRQKSLERLTIVCELWASGPPTLAGHIGRSSGVFFDQTEQASALQSSRLSVASAFMDASWSMIDLARQSRVLLAQYGTGHGERSPDDVEWVSPLSNKVARGFTPNDASAAALFQSMGYALGTQILAVQALEAAEAALSDVLGKDATIDPPHPPREWNMPDAVGLALEMCPVLSSEQASACISAGLESAWADLSAA